METHGLFLNIDIKNSADVHSKHVLLVINEHNQLTVTMATKEDISDMLKFNKTKNAFELPTFGGKTSKNVKKCLCHRSITNIN